MPTCDAADQPGEPYDSNGLLHLRARYYDAFAGRFFQLDPSGNERNLYEYSYSNPINYTDPSGFDPYWCDDYKNDPRKKQACIGWYLKNKGYQVNPEQRRAMAAQLARDWAAVDWPTWCKTGFWSPTCAYEDPAELKKWLESQDPPMNCFDCTRFVSWVLWSVGFPMDWTGGWWAQHVPEFTGKEEARAWSNADAFYLWWTSSDRGVMAAKVVAEENFMTLLPGDIIMYGRKIDSKSPEYPIYNGDTLDLNHAAMVTSVEQHTSGIWKPKVAARGAYTCDPGINPTGGPKDWYDNAERVGNYGAIKIGLHMPYEQLSGN